MWFNSYSLAGPAALMFLLAILLARIIFEFFQV